MARIGDYPQQTVVDNSDKFLMEDGASGETKHAEAADVKTYLLTNPYAFRAYRNTSTHSVGNNVFTKVQLNAESFDSNNNFDSATNFRYVAPVSGKYQVNWSAYVNAGTKLLTAIYKNGVELVRGAWIADPVSFLISNGSDIIPLAAGDYIELWALTTGAGTVINGEGTTFMSAYRAFS